MNHTLENDELDVGQVWRAKRPRRVNRFGSPDLVNDRHIVFVGRNTVQYDSPTVRVGRHFPSVSIEKFLKWAGANVTEGYPDDRFQTWDEYQEGKHAKI